MADQSTELLVKMQLLVENLQKVERFAEVLQAIQQIPGSTVVETVEFDVKGLDAARRQFEGTEDLSEKTAKEAGEAVGEIERYITTLEKFSKRLEALGRNKGPLLDIRNNAEEFAAGRSKVGSIGDEEFSDKFVQPFTELDINSLKEGQLSKISNAVGQLQTGGYKKGLEQLEQVLAEVTAEEQKLQQEILETGNAAEAAQQKIFRLAQALQEQKAASGTRGGGETSKNVKEVNDSISQQAVVAGKTSAEVSQLTTAINSLTKALSSFPATVSGAMEQVSDTVERLARRFDLLNTRLLSVQRSANAYNTQLKVLTREQREQAAAIQELGRETLQRMSGMSGATDQYSQSLERVRRAQIGFATSQAQSTASARQMGGAMGILGGQVATAEMGMIGFTWANDEVASKAPEAAKAVQDVAETVKDIGDETPKATEGVEKVGKAVADTGKKADQSKRSISNFTQAIRALASDRKALGEVINFAIGRLGIFAFASTVVYGIGNALRVGVREAVKFEEVLSQIQGVLPSRAEFQADLIGETAVQNAEKYGVALGEAAEAAKTFAQTGRTAIEISKDIDAAFRAVRGANLNVEQAKDLIIAIQNITDGEVEALELLDRFSRVEARRAITAQDLAVGFQRIGPVVKQLRGDMGGLVDEYDFAAGALTTIVEQTRVSGTAAATSLKFILSRLGNPQVIENLQALSGVGFSREGGRQLRPAVEILEELSIAFQRLQKEDSPKAFELLSVLGGSRQIQATAALLDDFGGRSLETARISATAFNDSAERTAIALDTIKASAQRAGAAWTNFAKSIFASEAMSEILQGVINFVGGTGNVATTFLRGFNVLADAITDIGSGGLIEPLRLGDVEPEQLKRVTRLSVVASRAGLTVDELVGKLNQLAEELTLDARAKYGVPFEEIVEQLASGKAGDRFRGLRETLGQRFADEVDALTGALEDYNERLEATDNASERARISSERIGAAFNIMGDALFYSTALLDLTRQRFNSTAEAFSESILSRLSADIETFRNMQDGIFGSDFGFSSSNPVNRLLGAIQKNSFSNTEFENFQNYVEFFEGRRTGGAVGGIGKQQRAINSVVGSYYDAARAAGIYAQAVEQAFNRTDLTTGQRVLLFEDLLSRSVLAAENLDEIVESVAGKVTDALGQQDGIVSADLITGQLGQESLNNFSVFLDKVITKVKESNTVSGEQVRYLELFSKGVTSALAAQDALVQSASNSMARLNQDLLNLFTTFTQNFGAASELADIYRSIGESFDETGQRISATRTLLEGLVRIPAGLSADAAKIFNQLQEANRARSRLPETGAEQEGADFVSNLLDAEGLQEGILRNAKELQATYDSLSAQIRSLDFVNLNAVFGGSPEGRTLLRDFVTFIDAMPEDITQATIAMAELLNRVATLYQRELDIQAVRERGLKVFEATSSRAIRDREAALEIERLVLDRQLNVQTSAVEANRRLLDLTTRRGEAISFQAQSLERLNLLEIQNIQQLADAEGDLIEARLKSAEGVIDKKVSRDLIGTRQAESDLLDAQLRYIEDINALEGETTRLILERTLALEEQRNQLGSGAILEAYQTLSQQINQNIQQATSGLRTVLRDYDSLKKGSLATLLTPVADTYLDRLAENFTASLFDATSDSFFGKIAAAYGAGPEERLKQTMLDTYVRGAQILGTEFDQFLTRMDTMLGRYFPEGAGGLPARTSTATTSVEKRREAGLLEQLGTLVSAQVGTALGANIGGNQANAGLGAGLGSSLSAAFLSTTVLGAFAGPIGGIVGGLIGGFLGGDDERKEQEEKKIQALSKIEYNTNRSATELELQRQFLDVARGAVNVPSAFTLPAYTPLGGSFSQSNSISIQVSVTNPIDGQEVINTITTELGPALTDELRRIGY